MKRKIKTLNIIGIILLVYQLLNYIALMYLEQEPITDTAEKLGSYVGANLALIIAVMLFARASSLKKRMRELENEKMIDEIGKY